MEHVLITGGSRRLGLYLTETFLARDWCVTVLTRHASEPLTELACEKLHVLQVDYCDEQAVLKLCEQLALEPIDAVIHNASAFLKDPLEPKITASTFQQLFDVHMRLPTLLNQTLGEQLSQSKNGNIIHMSDIYADIPKTDYALYSATKAGVTSLMKSFALQLAPSVRVNAIAPGAVKFLPQHSVEEKTEVLAQSLIQQEAGFEPVLQTIDYLIENPYITGTTVTIDGGRSLCR